MNEQHHGQVVSWIKCFRAKNGKYPTHEQILAKMLEVADEVTYRDAIEYGLGTTATVKAHKLEVAA